jgi:hypothetical protein
MCAQILAVSPGSIACLDGMAQVAFDNGQHETAIDLWSQAVAVSQKSNSELYLKIGAVVELRKKIASIGACKHTCADVHAARAGMSVS